MRILVVTSVPWRNDNSLGNSYSNIFKNIEAEFANVYLQSGIPENEVVRSYFQITEKNLVKNIKNKSFSTGKIINLKDLADVPTSKENSLYNVLRAKRWQIFFWGRELIWKLGDWKSDDLKAFLEDFNPDIIFAPLQTGMYINDVLSYIKIYTNKPMITYAWDDIYTLKQFSFSPLYWIDRFMQRSKIRRTVSLCEYLYVISEIQKNEYEKCLRKECRLLWKGYDFNVQPIISNKRNTPLKLLFSGNVFHGRWKTLKLIGHVLQKMNKDNVVAQLFIYTLSPVTSKIKKALGIPGSVFLMGGVSSDEVSKLQDEADILVHTEAFSLKDMLVARLSFSTKLVDYFYKRKCIFAVGKKESASIDYLIKNDAAIIATSYDEITVKLSELINNANLIEQYKEKAWNCGKRNHQINNIKISLYKDFNALVREMMNESITD